MPGNPLAAAFPAIHPFAVIIKFVCDEHGRRRINQAVAGSEELVRSRNHLGPQPGLGQVGMASGKIRLNAHL
jgi:hypothetical protein